VNKNKQTILLTGFGSFSDTDDNPSIKVVNHLLSSKEDWKSKVDLRKSIMEVSYEGCTQSFDNDIKQHSPDIVISFGLNASLQNTVVIEPAAYNSEEKYYPDVLGKLPPADKIDSSAPEELNPLFNVDKIVSSLSNLKNPAIEKSSFINYICNYYYFYALNQFRKTNPDNKALFIHIPQESETCSIDKISNACEYIVKTICSRNFDLPE